LAPPEPTTALAPDTVFFPGEMIRRTAKGAAIGARAWQKGAWAAEIHQQPLEYDMPKSRV